MSRKVALVMLRCIRAAMVIIAVLFGLLCVFDAEYNKYGGVLASFALPFLPVLMERIFRVKIAFRLQLIYYVFLFVALFMGIDMDMYRTLPYFDKVIHLMSGALTVLLAHYALVFFGLEKSAWVFRMIFMVCLAMAVGVVWEFFEFGCDKLLGQSMQQLVSVGVDDTMFDLLAATMGAVMGAVWMVRQKNLKFLKK